MRGDWPLEFVQKLDGHEALSSESSVQTIRNYAGKTFGSLKDCVDKNLRREVDCDSQGALR